MNPCSSPYGCDPNVVPQVPPNLSGYEPVYAPGFGWMMQETTSEEMKLFQQTLTQLTKDGVSFNMNGPFPVQGMTYAQYESQVRAFLEKTYHVAYTTVPQHLMCVITPVSRADTLGMTPQEL